MHADLSSLLTRCSALEEADKQLTTQFCCKGMIHNAKILDTAESRWTL